MALLAPMWAPLLCFCCSLAQAPGKLQASNSSSGCMVSAPSPFQGLSNKVQSAPGDSVKCGPWGPEWWQQLPDTQDGAWGHWTRTLAAKAEAGGPEPGVMRAVKNLPPFTLPLQELSTNIKSTACSHGSSPTCSGFLMLTSSPGSLPPASSTTGSHCYGTPTSWAIPSP